MTNPLITFKTDEYENKIELLSKTIAEKDAILANKDAQLLAASNLSNEKDATISQQDALIADLKRQLEEALAKSK